jgi:hypothetical protein
MLVCFLGKLFRLCCFTDLLSKNGFNFSVMCHQEVAVAILYDFFSCKFDTCSVGLTLLLHARVNWHYVLRILNWKCHSKRNLCVLKLLTPQTRHTAPVPHLWRNVIVPNLVRDCAVLYFPLLSYTNFTISAIVIINKKTVVLSSIDTKPHVRRHGI